MKDYLLWLAKDALVKGRMEIRGYNPNFRKILCCSLNGVQMEMHCNHYKHQQLLRMTVNYYSAECGFGLVGVCDL